MSSTSTYAKFCASKLLSEFYKVTKVKGHRVVKLLKYIVLLLIKIDGVHLNGRGVGCVSSIKFHKL